MGMSTGLSQDVAEFQSVEFDWDAIDRLEASTNVTEAKRLLSEIIHDRARELAREEVQMALVKFIALVIDSHNYRLKIDVAIASLGFPFYSGENFTSMGKRHNITKQAFSKHVLRFQDDFGLPPTRAQKSTASRKVYREAQLNKK